MFAYRDRERGRGRGRRRRAAGAALALTLTLGALTACSSSSPGLHRGDCFRAPADLLLHGDSGDGIQTVSCRRLHNSEVVGTHQLPAGPFPGERQLSHLAAQLCGADFRHYVGRDYRASAWDLYPLSPSTRTWARNRTLACVALTLPDRRGSVRGSDR